MNKMNEIILRRYEVKQNILKLQNQTNELRKIEDLLDKIITYKALLSKDVLEAKRFKRLHIDNRREGIFNIKVKKEVELMIPKF